MSLAFAGSNIVYAYRRNNIWSQPTFFGSTLHLFILESKEYLDEVGQSRDVVPHLITSDRYNSLREWALN